MARRSKREEQRKKIRDTLNNQLDKNGAAGEHYRDLVEDYMGMWDVKNGLIDDIKKRGEKVMVITAHGSNMKTNDSIGDLLKVSAQMLKLLVSMGIKEGQVEGAANGEM